MPKQPDHSIRTRQSLLNRIKDPEDHDSWCDFVETYSGLIYGVARKAGLTDTEAQEAVQETLIWVSKKIPAFSYDPSIGSFKGWLRKTTKWRVDDQLRKRGRDANLSVRDPKSKTGTATVERIPDPAGYDLEGVWDQEWAKWVFEAALKRVKDQARNSRLYQIFDLSVLKQLPAEVIAKKLGVRLSHVYVARHRMLHLFRKEVQKLEEGPDLRTSSGRLRAGRHRRPRSR